ncbi:MAG: cytochrome d ubiquinol oxidase subunit II [Bacteroidaceae bacterium]|nr:cytochrome d ubiquinol oxidase subunit II [Bacteroidaceae bacterium]
MISLDFLQQYWWFLISLLGGLLVFLLFVQGGNSLYHSLGHDEASRRMLINSTGRKWEFTFTTLVTFGGAFFASFPLFYSTSFGGAYWLWMLILLSFVLQVVSYEFQSHVGNVLGRRGYRLLLQLNGFMGPFLLGVAVATFFTGSDFVVDHLRLSDISNPIVSHWGNSWHGLEALANPWNLVLGLAVFFLSRVLALQYFINNVRDDVLESRASVRLLGETALFLLCFLAFLGRLLTMNGFAVNQQNKVIEEPLKYLHNLLEQPSVLVIFLIGVALVLVGTIRTILSKTYRRGIWLSGTGTVLTVTALFLLAGWNGTCYYPSLSDPCSSLHLSNTSASIATLQVMFFVSLLIPFVLAYIFYCWRAIDRQPITREEMKKGEHLY